MGSKLRSTDIPPPHITLCSGSNINVFGKFSVRVFAGTPTVMNDVRGFTQFLYSDAKIIHVLGDGDFRLNLLKFITCQLSYRSTL
jgi:hypothetical protein